MSQNLVFYDTLKYNAQRSWVLGLTWLPLYDIAPAPENAGGGKNVVALCLMFALKKCGQRNCTLITVAGSLNVDSSSKIAGRE